MTILELTAGVLFGNILTAALLVLGEVGLRFLEKWRNRRTFL